MLVINYKNDIPQQRFYALGVRGNNKSNKIKFVVARKQADIDLLGLVCNLKVENKEHEYKDLILLHGAYKETTNTIEFVWEMTERSTQFRSIELQLEFLGEEDVVWQTLIAELELNETIKVGDEKPTDQELSALKQLEVEVNEHENEITHLQEEMVDCHNIIIANPDNYLNDSGLNKIIRKEENGSIEKSYLINKKHTDSTLVVCEQHREENEYYYNDMGEMVEDLGENNFNQIFGDNCGYSDFYNVYSLYYNQNGVITKGFKIGRNDFENLGAFALDNCTPNKVIRLVVGKYFEYDENGNKIFDEHCVLFGDSFDESQQGIVGNSIEITEERQEVLLKTGGDGHIYFDSDGNELGFGNTRFILYSIETGEEAKDEYKKVEIGKNVLPITYNELKALRDSGDLVEGCFYHITDYQCTTSQNESKSAGHQFDIIVQAVSKNELSENAHAIKHEGDTYFKTCKLEAWELKYCLDNDENRFAWAGKVNAIIVDMHYREIFLRYPSGDNNKGYCWAFVQDSEGADNFSNYDVSLGNINEKVLVYSHSEYPLIGSKVLLVQHGVEEDEYEIIDVQYPRGVIYYMRDEWNNECPYDFKNIQFKRYLVQNSSCPYIGFNNKYVGFTDSNTTFYPKGYNQLNAYLWAYTFSYRKSNDEVLDTSIAGNDRTLTDEEGYICGVYGNIIKEYCPINNEMYLRIYLNNIVFLSDYNYNQEAYLGCYSNIFENGCHNFTFGNVCHNNTFESLCRNNVFNDDCYDIIFNIGCNENIFGNLCRNNVFGNGCYDNIFGNTCHSNIFGDSCYNNTFSKSCYNNTFGRKCSNNTFRDNCTENIFVASCTINSFGRNCRYNKLENGCSQNTFGLTCTHNILGAGSNNNSFGGNCKYNTLETYCEHNTFGNTCTSNTFGNKCSYNTFGEDCNYNIFGNNCYRNTFGDSCFDNAFGEDCGDNTFGNNCANSTFGSHCTNNTFGEDCTSNAFGNGCSQNTFGYDCSYNAFGNGVEYINLNINETRNIIIENGCSFIQFQTSGSSGYLQNVHVHLGVKGASSTNPKVLSVARENAFETSFKPTNSVEVNV
jgi:hypothetical protein